MVKVYHSNLAIESLAHARSFLLTWAEIDHTLNQLCSGLMKQDLNISMIYKCIHALDNRIVTPTVTDMVNLTTISINIKKALPNYLSLPCTLESNI